MLECVAGQRMAKHVAARDPVDAREGDEVRVRSHGIERIDLHAAERVEHGAHAGRPALATRPGETQLPDEVGPRLAPRQHARAIHRTPGAS